MLYYIYFNPVGFSVAVILGMVAVFGPSKVQEWKERHRKSLVELFALWVLISTPSFLISTIENADECWPCTSWGLIFYHFQNFLPIIAVLLNWLAIYALIKKKPGVFMKRFASNVTEGMHWKIFSVCLVLFNAPAFAFFSAYFYYLTQDFLKKI